MATGESKKAYSAAHVPSGATNARRFYTYFKWSTSETATTFSVTVSVYAGVEGGSCTNKGNPLTLSATGQSSSSATMNWVYKSTTKFNPINRTFTWNKGTSSATKTITSALTIHSGSRWAGTYKSSVNFTVPALAKVTISFNANGGSGTVASIPTYYGVSTKLASGGYSKTGYNLTGWNTKADGTGTNYALGANISTTASIILYAIWKTTYVSPIIDNLVAFRALDNSGGASPTVTASGTTGFCELKVTGGNAYTVTSVSIKFGDAVAKTGIYDTQDSTYYNYSDVDTIPKESEKPVYITVIVKGDDDVQRTLTAQTYISKAEISVDISANGKSVAIGGEARDNQVENELLVFGNLEVRGIEYSMTEAEFQELETLLGGGQLLE